MPVHTGSDNEGCFARWGEKGAKYRYPCGDETARKEAKSKAYQQGLAIGEYADQSKVSIDYDDTLSTDKGKELAKRKIAEGKTVYIVTRRHKLMGSTVYNTAKELGIPADRVYFTEGKLKWETIKRLNIGTHYDNNQNEIDKINELTEAKGILFK